MKLRIFHTVSKRQYRLNFLFFIITLLSLLAGRSVSAQSVSYDQNSVPVNGVNSVAIGKNALASDGGQFNIGIGFEALRNNTIGPQNVAIGYQSMYSNIGGGYNVAVGLQTLYQNQGNFNTALGYGSLYTNAGGERNTATGYKAMMQNNGSYNMANGFQAMYSNVSGDENTANGYQALFANVSGNRSTAVGFEALYNNLQSYTTGTGYKALYNNTTGNENTANGSWALHFTTTGSGNTGSGYAAIHKNSTGGQNTGFGVSAIFNNTTGSGNTGIGWQALYQNISGSNNTAIGMNAGVATDGLNNTTAIGNGALVYESDAIQLGNASVSKVYNGVGNTAIFITGQLQVTGGVPGLGKVLTSDASGIATWQPLPAAPINEWKLTGNAGTADNVHFIGTTDNVPFNIRVNNARSGRIDHLNGNTFFGFKCGEFNMGNGNTANGMRALTTNTTGFDNTAIGLASMYFNTTGNRNTAVGVSSLLMNSTGENNTAIGFATLVSGSNLSNNTAVGFRALTQNFAGAENTAVGSKAMESNTTGENNVALGYKTLNSNIDGFRNTAAGWNALTNNISGSQNTAFGERALISNVSGSYNTAIGAAALGDNIDGIYNTAIGIGSQRQNTSGSGNTAIGQRSLLGNLTGNRNTGLGAYTYCGTSFSNATAIGYNASSNDNDKIRLGNTTVRTIEGTVIYTVSDGRFKTNITEKDVKGLAFIKKLRPVVYNFDTRKFQEFLNTDLPDSIQKEMMQMDFGPSTSIRQSGFIAQEVEAAAKETGYDFNGVHKPSSVKDNYSLAYGQFVVPLVKAVQEQQAMIEKQQAQIDELRKLLLLTETKTPITYTELSNSENIQWLTISPNPFSGEVNIRYQMPAGSQQGKIVFSTVNGQPISSETLQGDGTGILKVNTQKLTAGVYTCSLYVNGKLVASEKMIRQ
ncbi:MAG: tail fiber domain-containing protein [Bacteroidetes bacterium]|nr:tail fiber domain-containing protein [Bacteroidota bacterium]